MGILDELLKKSTGMQSLLGGSIDGTSSSPDETYMPVEYSKDQAFTDPYTNVKKIDTKFGPANKSYPHKYDPVTGKPMDAATEQAVTSNFPTQENKIDESAPSGSIVPPEKPNAINQMAKLPNLFENVFGMSVDKLSENWKKKGGFEGLMANPGFLLGMSILQSSAQGKSIGSGVFDAAVKAGTISAAYADKIKSKQGLLAPVTEEQRDSMKGVAEEQGITAPGILDKMKNLFGGNAEAMYREALDDIYVEAERLAQEESKRLGKKVRFDPRKFGKQAMKNLQASGKLTIRKDRMYRSGTLQAKTSEIEGNRAKGGPIKAGKNYVVGEEGPEMFVAETNGTIINNDDSKVVSMLLESNPQLKNVSRARAVKILKARFPDYF
jgi:hypothetical protein